MTQRPPDLSPDERAFYDMFKILRTEVFDIVDEVATLVLDRIERRQADEARLMSPEPVELAGGSLFQVIGAVSRIFRDPSGDEDELTSRPDLKEEEKEEDE